MKNLREIIYLFTTFSIVFNLIQIFLILKKLWKNKHSKEVVSSLSLLGNFMAFSTSSIWGFYFLIEKDWLAIVNQILWITLFLIQTLVAMGIWVKSESK